MNDEITSLGSLTPRDRAFVEGYLKHSNATRAYIEAGFDTEGQSAQVCGSQKLRQPMIRSFLASLQEKSTEDFILSRSLIMQETDRLARFDARKLFDEDGKFKGIKDLDSDTAAAIAGFDFTEIRSEGVTIGQTVKIKLANKGQALDMAHKILGSYKADNDQKSADAQVIADFVHGLQAANKGIPLAKKRKAR